MPVPQTLPRTETGTLSRDRTREAERDCSKSQGRDKDCVECPPSRGEMAIANNGKGHSMSDLSARYQQWVTNFPFPHEWFWSGTWWDGFDEPRCTLLEAKANYAFLFVPLLGVQALGAGQGEVGPAAEGRGPQRQGPTDPAGGRRMALPAADRLSTAPRSTCAWDWPT